MLKSVWSPLTQGKRRQMYSLHGHGLYEEVLQLQLIHAAVCSHGLPTSMTSASCRTSLLVGGMRTVTVLPSLLGAASRAILLRSVAISAAARSSPRHSLMYFTWTFRSKASRMGYTAKRISNFPSFRFPQYQNVVSFAKPDFVIAANIRDRRFPSLRFLKCQKAVSIAKLEFVVAANIRDHGL